MYNPNDYFEPNPAVTAGAIVGTILLSAVGIGGIVMGVRESRYMPRRPPVDVDPEPLTTSEGAGGSGYSGVTREEMQELQVKLAARGYDPGTPDGLWSAGGTTWSAIWSFQDDYGLEATGDPDANTRRAIREAPPRAPREPYRPSGPGAPAPTPGAPAEPVPQRTYDCYVRIADDHPPVLGAPHGSIVSGQGYRLDQAVALNKPSVELTLTLGLRWGDIAQPHRHTIHLGAEDIQRLRAGEEVVVETSSPSDRFDQHSHRVVISCKIE